MKVFISHKSDDKMYANEVYKALRRIGGVNAWVDIFELNAGDSLGKIESSVGDSDAVIVLWSSSTDASEWVRKEIETGSHERKRIIPCILDRTLPASNPTLADRLYIDLSDRLLGMSHLCLSYILPTALDAGWAGGSTRCAARVRGVRLAQHPIHHHRWQESRGGGLLGQRSQRSLRRDGVVVRCADRGRADRRGPAAGAAGVP